MMTVARTKPAAVLRRAAELIEAHGWTQWANYRTSAGVELDADQRWRPGCSMCITGAVVVAIRDLTTQDPSAPDIDDALLAVESDIGHHVPTWNDTKGRTVEQVVAQLHRTAGRLEAEEHRTAGPATCGGTPRKESA